MLFQIDMEEEDAIEMWMKQHIIDCHWEYSTQERESIETNSSQYSFMIFPSRNYMNNYDGYVRCNYCGDRYQFRKRV